MPVVTIDPASPDASVLERAAAILRGGGLVAFPTETVYGLGANALDATAVERIYAAKGRPSYNPLIVHVASAEHVSDVAREWPPLAESLARAFWPGPLTLVLPKRPEVPDAVTAGLDSVAVRVPSNPIAHALLETAKLPIAAPSANRSMMLSPTTAEHVAKSLGDAVDLILDGGPTTVGIESTVLDLTTDPPTVLRPGSISVPQLEAVIGTVSVATHAAASTARSSPGMMDRHYSPRARLLVASAKDLPALLRRERESGTRVAALVIDATVDYVTTTRMPAEPAGYAAQLYAALHDLDDAAFEVIVVERVPNDPAWFGVRDRLERAARS